MRSPWSAGSTVSAARREAWTRARRRVPRGRCNAELAGVGARARRDVGDGSGAAVVESDFGERVVKRPQVSFTDPPKDHVLLNREADRATHIVLGRARRAVASDGRSSRRAAAQTVDDGVIRLGAADRHWCVDQRSKSPSCDPDPLDVPPSLSGCFRMGRGVSDVRGPSAGRQVVARVPRRRGA